MNDYISAIVVVVGKVLFNPLIFALYTNTDNELTGFFWPCTFEWEAHDQSKGIGIYVTPSGVIDIGTFRTT